MKIACVSDIHGHLPEIPEGDLVLLGGNTCPVTNHDPRFQARSLDTVFRQWLDSFAPPVVAVAGNHDFIYESQCYAPPELPWDYLQDSGCEVSGLKVFGSPWQPP